MEMNHELRDLPDSAPQVRQRACDQRGGERWQRMISSLDLISLGLLLVFAYVSSHSLRKDRHVGAVTLSSDFAV